MPGLFHVRPGSVREVGDEAAGRRSERNYNDCPQGTDCVRTVHFLRDVAKPVLEADSHAKVQMRTKVRGLRGIEQSVLKRRRRMAEEESQALPQSSIVIETADTANVTLAEEEPAGDVVLAYCAVVRGILNDDQGGPLHPPGLRMAQALNEVRQSIQRNMDAKKGGSQKSNSAAWPPASTEAWTRSNLSRVCSANRSRRSKR